MKKKMASKGDHTLRIRNGRLQKITDRATFLRNNILPFLSADAYAVLIRHKKKRKKVIGVRIYNRLFLQPNLKDHVFLSKYAIGDRNIFFTRVREDKEGKRYIEAEFLA